MERARSGIRRIGANRCRRRTWRDATAILLGGGQAELLTTSSDDYSHFASRGESRHRMPVYRQPWSACGIRYYLDPLSGEVVTLDGRYQCKRGYRWLHEGLHRLDFTPALYAVTCTSFRHAGGMLPLMLGVHAGLRHRRVARHPYGQEGTDRGLSSKAKADRLVPEMTIRIAPQFRLRNCRGSCRPGPKYIRRDYCACRRNRRSHSPPRLAVMLVQMPAAKRATRRTSKAMTDEAQRHELAPRVRAHCYAEKLWMLSRPYHRAGQPWVPAMKRGVSSPS